MIGGSPSQRSVMHMPFYITCLITHRCVLFAMYFCLPCKWCICLIVNIRIGVIIFDLFLMFVAEKVLLLLVISLTAYCNVPKFKNALWISKHTPSKQRGKFSENIGVVSKRSRFIMANNVTQSTNHQFLNIVAWIRYVSRETRGVIDKFTMKTLSYCYRGSHGKNERSSYHLRFIVGILIPIKQRPFSA